MQGIIGKKVGMTSLFDEQGNNIPCTVLQCGPCAVIQIKSEEKDGYNSVQIGFENKRDNDKLQKNYSSVKYRNYVSKPQYGHYQKAKVVPKQKVVEIRDYEGVENLKVGENQIDVDIFELGEFVDVTATSKGKGFQGVVKRHGFAGVGQATHGQHNRLRAPGSIGACATPSRVFKGMRMAGRMGNETVTVQNLKVMVVDKDKKILVVKGAVPGHKNSYVVVKK